MDATASASPVNLVSPEHQRLIGGTPAVTAVDVAHRRAVAQRVATGGNAECRSNVDGPGHGIRAITAQLGQGERGRQRAVGAVGVHGEAALRRSPDSCACLVGEDQGFQQRCPRQSARLAFGQDCRHDLDARMRARAEVALVQVVPRAGSTVDEGGIGRSETLPRTERRCRCLAGAGSRLQSYQPAHLRDHTARDNAADAVRQD